MGNVSSTTEFRQELECNGYAIVDFLDRDELQIIRDFIQAKLPPSDLEATDISFSAGTLELSYRQAITKQVKKIFSQKLIELLPEHRVLLCNLVRKKPDSLHSEMPLHQDPSLTDEAVSKSYGVWCPLIDVDEHNGCLQVVQQSHLLNSHIRPFFTFEGFPYSQEILALMQQHLTSLPMKAGQALIYDKRLFHGSPPNLTTVERVAAICSLVPKEILSHFCYRETSTSNMVELFEVEDEFYDRYIVGQRPEGVKSLGTFDYEVEPLTPEILIEKLGEGKPDQSLSPVLSEDFRVRTAKVESLSPSWANAQVSFKPAFLEKFNQANQKIAVLVSNEFEGFSKNGGIGTYYTALSQKLVIDGWTVILLLCQTETEFQGESIFGEVDHVFSTAEATQVLTLQPIHQQILFTTQQNDLDKSFDYQSFCCLFFLQALIAAFPDAVVYAEFPEIWGFGYRTIQAKRSGLLGNSCLIGVTAHGSFEWLNEINSKYSPEHAGWYWQAHHYEQFCYETADITYSPSHFLQSKLSKYGWKTAHVKHLPYFVPSLTLTSNKPTTAPDKRLLNKIPIVFFARLEERKGLSTFLEALKLLDDTIAAKVHPVFIGKIIPLQSSHLKHLNSQEYIDRELGNSFTYTLLSDLSSQEAIQAIADFQHPIVCLTSLQENFPNTALEMGQLPVSLVVSDTGGFRETLDLLQRSEALHWFQPGSPPALAEALTQAIRAYPEHPKAIIQTTVEQINRHLLNQRLELMSQAFLEAAPKELTTPSVTIALTCWHSSPPLIDCLTGLSAQTYQPLDVIVLSPADDESIQTAIAQAQTQFPGHKYLTAAPYSTLGEAYNYLVEQSPGEYVLVLSADRIATPTMIETMVAAAAETKAVAVVCPLRIGADEQPESITPVDGNLLKLLEFNHRYDLTALFSRQFLQQFPYSQERNLQALNWQIFAAAIATDQAIAYYPYPLFTIPPKAASTIPTANLARERYYLRQYLFQIKPEQWHQRQINLLLTGFEQLVQSRSQHQHQPSSPQDQAWMITAQQMHHELTYAQARLKELETWNRELQTGKEWLESQWQAWMLKAQKLGVDWEQGRSLIQQMQGSKFWQLRNYWLKLKRKPGKIPTDPLQPAAHTFTPGVQEFVARVAGQKIRFFQAAATQTPVVSLISSCFNETEYLETTYRSIINQTLQNIEWIIVDDGSTNPEVKVLLTALSQRTDKIRILSHATHQGIAASYNTAIAEARGEYLCFVAIGSILDPTYLEKGALFLETHPQVSVVNSYSIVFQAQEHWWQPNLNQPVSLMQQNGLISHPLYRKTDFHPLGGFDESLPNFADWERTLKAISKGQTGWTIPEYLDCYRATLENAPVIAQDPEQQQTINRIQSRYQSVLAHPQVISLEPQPLKLETLNFQLNLENQRTISNPGKRILLFCDALDASEISKWNCDLVIWLDKCGYDVTIVTTATSNHSCQEFFYQATPDIFHLANLLERSHWLAFVRYILKSRQMDSVLISGSTIAYAFLPLLRVEFPSLVLIDYTQADSQTGQNNGCSTLFDPVSQSLDYRLVPSRRQAREYGSLNSATPRTKVCYTPPDIASVLAEVIRAHSSSIPPTIDTESGYEAQLLLLEYLRQPGLEHKPEASEPEKLSEPTVREILKLLVKKLVKV